MTKLRAPLKHLLDQPLPEASVQRLWRAVNESGRPSVPARARWVGTGALAAFALSALLWFTAGGGRSVPAGAALTALHGAGVAESGLVPGATLGDATGNVTVPLSDGSRLELQGGALLRVIDNASGVFETQLQRGRVTFDVKPGGPRRWHIDCGAATVDVLGTRFVIERDDKGVRVEVSRGVVSVRSAQQPTAAQRLTAGQSWYVAAAAEPSHEPARTGSSGMQPTAAGPTAELHDGAGDVERGEPRVDDVTPRAEDAVDAERGQPRVDGVTPPAEDAVVAERGQPRVGGAMPGAASAGDARRELDREARLPRELEALLRAADAARHARQRERAQRLLERAVRLAPDSPHAAVAALTLARDLMDDDPARAVRALEFVSENSRAPAWLREDMLARLVEAHARAGQAVLAARAAAAYALAYPEGRWSSAVQRWAAAP